MNNVSQKPCPICRNLMFVLGKSTNGETITSCGHQYKFKKTKSQKDMDRNYRVMPWGLEKII